MNRLFRFFIVVSAASLSACSTYATTFDCPKGDGLSCASLSKVNQLMDRGEIDLQTDPQIQRAPPQGSLEVYRGPTGDEPSGQTFMVPLKAI